jgi:hypothetical protein
VWSSIKEEEELILSAFEKNECPILNKKFFTVIFRLQTNTKKMSAQLVDHSEEKRQRIFFQEKFFPTFLPTFQRRL